MKKNTVKQAIVIFITMMILTVIQYAVATERNKDNNKETKEVEPVKTKTENLVIDTPKQNSTGTVTIVTYDKQTGEETTTEVHGTIKVLSNGYDGEQKYLVYTITE